MSEATRRRCLEQWAVGVEAGVADERHDKATYVNRLLWKLSPSLPPQPFLSCVYKYKTLYSLHSTDQVCQQLVTSSSGKCINTTNTDSSVLGFIVQRVSNTCAEVTLRLYLSLVRSCLDYDVQFWFHDHIINRFVSVNTERTTSHSRTENFTLRGC